MDIVSIGECMVEFSCEGSLSDAKTFTKTFGGDTMNLLVAANRLGARTGYITVGAGGLTTHVPAYSPGSVVDSTGAGDAFGGAFLYGVLQGYPPLQAARLGAITAGLKLKGRGAIASLPTREEVYRIFAPSP